MTIEITSMKITDRALGTVRMTATDCSEERAQYLERYRDDGFEKELVYEWNTKDPTQQYWFRRKAAGHADERTTYRNYVFDRSTPAEKMQKFEAALDYKNRMQPHATPAATNE